MRMRYTKRASDVPNRYASDGVANGGEKSEFGKSIIVRRAAGYEMSDWDRVLTIEQSVWRDGSCFVTSAAGYVCE